MTWIELGEWGFDMDDVAAVHRHPATGGTPVGRARAVTDVYLGWGPVLTLEADEAAEFLERWAAPPGQGRRPPAVAYGCVRAGDASDAA